jgi:hypothetical protein
MGATMADSTALRSVRRRHDALTRARARERQAGAELNAAIVAARAQGATLKSIGDILGLTPQRIEQMAKQGQA